MANELTSKTPSATRKWLDEIEVARKREKDWRKEATRILEIYNGKKVDEIPFNILYSNTETLAPALFSANPRPVVQRRFKDADPLGKLAATAGQRALEYAIDTNSEEYAPFSQVIRDAVMDALLPGRGVVIVKYDPKTGDAPDPSDPEGKKTTPVLLYENVCFESVEWDRIVFGYSRKWVKTPWMAIEYFIDKQEATKLYGSTIANQLKYASDQDRPDEENKNEKKDEGEKNEERLTAQVWKVWDKDGGRRILHISPDYPGNDFLKIEDDELELENFFPCVDPLRLIKKSNDQSPTPLYCLYENQARELNKITVRINRIVEALKVRGAYDGQLGQDISKIFEKDDNELIPAENVSALQTNQGLEKSIWLVPIDKLIQVLQQLLLARDAAKRTIYEITGIADILRGNTAASETATAQEIKDKWGTLRLKSMQAEVARFVRDTLRLAMEIAAKRFSERTWSQMTGMPDLVPSMQKQMAQMIVQRSLSAGVQPQPQDVQAAQSPSWGEVLQLLKSDTARTYRVDIETNSTVDPEATEDQKNIMDALTALGQTLQGITPLVVAGSMPFQIAQQILLTVARRFQFGVELEDSLKAMQPPQPQDQGKQAEMQAKLEMEREKHSQDMKSKAFQQQLDEQNAQREGQRKDKEMAMEMAFKEREHALKMAELDRKEAHAHALHQVKVAGLQAQVVAAHAMPKKPPAKPKQGNNSAAT